jgi:hypothetical protein
VGCQESRRSEVRLRTDAGTGPGCSRSEPTSGSDTMAHVIAPFETTSSGGTPPRTRLFQPIRRTCAPLPSAYRIARVSTSRRTINTDQPHSLPSSRTVPSCHHVAHGRHHAAIKACSRNANGVMRSHSANGGWKKTGYIVHITSFLCSCSYGCMARERAARPSVALCPRPRM